ncbi:MAG: hypothetical protein AAFX10_00740 [Pseudomonadota bacterium]
MKALRLGLLLLAVALSACARWAIEHDLETWECSESECRARLWLENPYETKVVVTTYVVAYQEVGVQRDTGARDIMGGFEQPAGTEDVEVGRQESRHVLEPNEARQVIETVAVTLKPSKLALLVSEARSVVD